MKLPVVTLKVTNSEENIVEALRGYTKFTGGKFPKSITDWSEWTKLAVPHSKNGRLSQEVAQVMGYLGAILPFLTQMSNDDYEYVGAGKSVDDERTIVFWYRNDNGKFRAIYNDLTVSDVPAKALPQSKE